jgi:hypothetical protein
MSGENIRAKFVDHYEDYLRADKENDAGLKKVFAKLLIDDVHQLVGANYTDKNECAKVVATFFPAIGMEQQGGLELYQKLCNESQM